MPHLQSALGICAIIAIAWALSENRSAFSWRMVAGTLAAQAVIAVLLLEVPFVRDLLFGLNGAVVALSEATRSGTSFIYGFLGGGPTPFTVTQPANMINLAFGVLPLIIVISALSAILWYWRILPAIVGAMAAVLKRSMGLGGAVGLSAAATVFLGNVEGQLVIRPYLGRLTRTELFILMTVGLSVIAGTVFVLYATLLKDVLPGALGHLLVASMMSLPGGILIARIMVPGPADTDVEGKDATIKYHSTMDAMSRGTEDGLKIYLQIIAMLIVMTALTALVNIILSALPPVFGAPLTIERMLGWLFAPMVWLYGVPWHEAATAGSLAGIKVVLTELIAYVRMAALPPGSLDPRATQIMVYAMCGFGNLASVGILIGGMSAIIPERREEIVSLAMKALVSGTLASGLTGAMIGLLPL
ncbi:MAG: nucleoside:proton symporter [Alphaproteobacteria bacterium 64-11]|nr:nucleoside:proton symporter [Alphaproteobacteria bacterium]OJU08625.1 MAG: nucleoside:proton symporter [Alphaproteobacteria bacterium 64-11]